LGYVTRQEPVARERTKEAGIHRLITDESGLDGVLARLRRAERYALDTEFHRERTYWPVLALLQVAWPAEDGDPAGVAVIDPLAVDVAPLASVLAGPGVMVAHAADQDLELLERICGRGPSALFDTQIAAGFAGHSSASLAALSKAFLGQEVAKGDRLTDWRTRPLTESQLSYAAADVQHLLSLADSICADLARSGRRSWADEESEALRVRPHGPVDPQRAWWKLRDSRSLRGAARGVAQEVAAWRERRAQAIDQPVRSVLSDLAIQAIAHRPPTSIETLNRTRGLEGRHLRPAVAAEVLEAVAQGRALANAELQLPPADDVPKEQRAPVGLVMAWISQVARDERIDPSLLATRSDVATFLRGDRKSRIASGWRSVILAEPMKALVEGRAALAFGGGSRLVLEERSGRVFPATPPSGGRDLTQPNPT
jgi:ribonuclease D